MTWFQRNRQKIETVSHFVTAVVTPLALIVTVLALVYTTLSSERQLRLLALSFQGSMVNESLRETRELAKRYDAGEASPSEIFATFQAIFLQYDLETIPEDYWIVFDKDFCGLMELERLRRAWEVEDRELYWPKFAEYADEAARRAKTSAC